MTTAQFGRLESVPLTDAWSHEAHDFTPWLAENLDRLSDALGFPLELMDTEVAVENFSADILARNPQDDSQVLIENQFKASDHTHLGQILTYLAGLDAKTVIWIAPSFREPHLSAIRWLNEHTEEPFAFFAVELRVVRIGSSPMVPLFDVVERPNNWDRRVQEVAREMGEITELGSFRNRFWMRLLQRHPDEGGGGQATAASSRWRAIPELNLVVAQYVTKRTVGVFVRGNRGVSSSVTAARLVPFADKVSERLDAEFNGQSNNFFFLKYVSVAWENDAEWDRAADWLHAEAERYLGALKAIVTATPASA